MHFALMVRRWLAVLCPNSALVVALLLVGGARLDATPPVTADSDAIVSDHPMRFTAVESGVYGQLLVAPEILTPGSRGDLVYTITSEPTHGRVGLAGGDDDADFFATKRARLGYFAYRADDDFVGEDSFAYTVRNETTGLIFRNTVVITVPPPEGVELPHLEVTATYERSIQAREVLLTTRPNTPVETTLPGHIDFMTPEDRAAVTDPSVVFLIDDKARPQSGSARLDRATGRLAYSPHPGFIGEDRFSYYTIDENNPHLGMDNTVTIRVEPVRTARHVVADRSRSREVDLVFVINNSPSMAAHQDRIAANLSRFRELFHTRGLDYRIGVLTTDFVSSDRPYYKEVRSIQIDRFGRPVLDSRQRPRAVTKRVASNGHLVTLPVMDQPWITPATPDGIFAELVRVGTNGDSNRTAFTAVYNFIAGYHNRQHSFLRPDAPTIVVYFMDEEETRMAVWKERRTSSRPADGTREAEWIEDGRLPDLIRQFNARHPGARQTLDGYINAWVLRPFIIAKGGRRGKVEMHAVVRSDNLSHRRAAELTGGTVLDIESDFSAPLAALGDRIADTVAVALDPLEGTATLYQKSLRVLVDGEEIPCDPENGYTYDELTHSIRFQGAARKRAFAARIDITYEEHL